MKINLEFLKSLFFQNWLCCICKEKNLKSGLICDSCLKNYERESRKFLFKNEFFIHCTGSYDENIKNALLRYKYGRESYLYKVFARIFKSYMEKNFMDFDVFLTVPSHKNTVIKRGFDHMRTIGDEISKTLNIKFSKDNLIKVKDTKPQHFLKADERKTNLSNSFKIINADEFRDKKILILDDMVTTGYTMFEVEKILRKCKPEEITGLCLLSGKKVLRYEINSGLCRII